MFWRLRQWIEPFPDTCRGVNVAQLKQEAQRVYDELIACGSDDIGQIDRALMRPIAFAAGKA